MAVTKKEIADYLAANHNLTGKAANEIVGDVFKFLGNELGDGNEVNIDKFGKFTIGERAARTGRNPQTGEAIEIAASKSVSFKASKGIKEALNA